jgi:membrane protein
VNRTLSEWLDRARTFVTVDLWSAEPPPGSERRLVRMLQFAIMVGEGFVRDRLLLRASALTYFTVLSMVPLLAVATSIAGAIGVGSEGFLEPVLNAIAAGSPEAHEKIRARIENANFAGLGTLGAAVLFVTTVLAISNVERALNEIWGVRQARGWSRRFPDYLAVLIVGPLLGGIAISLSTTLQSEWLLKRMLELPGFARLHEFGLRQAPWIVLSLGFAFLYWFLPNTRVRPLSALLGGLPAGLLTVAAQGLYLDFSVGVVKYNAFFGSFAALPLLFVWIYVFWAIALLGAEIAFAHQNLDLYRREVRGMRPGAAAREAIGMRIALEVAQRFRDAVPPLDADALSDALGVPVRTVRDVADHLISGGILSVRAGGESDEGLQLGRPAECILVTDVLASLRGEPEAMSGDAAVGAIVEVLQAELEEGVVKGAGGRTLADLLADLPPAVIVDRPTACG